MPEKRDTRRSAHGCGRRKLMRAGAAVVDRTKRHRDDETPLHGRTVLVGGERDAKPPGAASRAGKTSSLRKEIMKVGKDWARARPDLAMAQAEFQGMVGRAHIGLRTAEHRKWRLRSGVHWRKLALELRARADRTGVQVAERSDPEGAKSSGPGVAPSSPPIRP